MRETLLQAALLIEKFTGIGGWQGISPDVDDAEVSSEAGAELRQALIVFAQKHRDHPAVGSAIWALSKLRDRSLRGFFLSEMRRHYSAGRHDSVSQADCALWFFGDGVGYDYAPGESNPEHYFEAVRKYLETHNEHSS